MQINDVIKAHGLKEREVASRLFSKNKHPLAAFRRVAAGRGNLTADQLAHLAALCGVTMDELTKGGWKGRAQGDLIRFTRGDVVVTYNRTSGKAHVSGAVDCPTIVIEGVEDMTVRQLLEAAAKIDY